MEREEGQGITTDSTKSKSEGLARYRPTCCDAAAAAPAATAAALLKLLRAFNLILNSNNKNKETYRLNFG